MTLHIVIDDASSYVRMFIQIIHDYKEILNRIDNSREGHVLYLFEGNYVCDENTAILMTQLLEERDIPICIYAEQDVIRTRLGRRSFVSDRHVMRLTRPGIAELASMRAVGWSAEVNQFLCKAFKMVAKWDLENNFSHPTYRMVVERKEDPEGPRMVFLRVMQGSSVIFSRLV